MKFIEVGVDDALFQGWLKETQNNFHLMLETMVRVAEEIKEKVQTEFAPIETGRLSRSFRTFVLADNSRWKIVEIQMSALNPKTGYDYAYTQHLGYRHDKSGNIVYYNHGLKDLGFFTYRSDYDGGYDTLSDSTYELHQGGSQYMYWAIKYTENTAFEMIETDYLSMFQGGFIV